MKKEDVEENIEDEVSENEHEEEAVNESGPTIEELQEENKKLKEDYLRAFADAENTKKRCLQEIEKNNKYAISAFAKNLLSGADNLQRAIDAAGKEENKKVCENLLKGVELTQSELTRVFDKFDIHKMDSLGKVFDPNFHQVIQEVEDKSKAAGTIIAEVQTGYMIHDRILREAMVVVTKA
ncbi:MAG: nucleotide exchange factor GrpE [Alphaproteobacteria bacterium]|nr:nucleotide exchange factor GrpE [Alphaproteobacteria bacterium]